jgi:hypothetical protein
MSRVLVVSRRKLNDMIRPVFMLFIRWIFSMFGSSFFQGVLNSFFFFSFLGKMSRQYNRGRCLIACEPVSFVLYLSPYVCALDGIDSEVSYQRDTELYTLIHTPVRPLTIGTQTGFNLITLRAW